MHVRSYTFHIIYIYIYVYMYICIYVYTHVHTYIDMHIYICIYIYVCVCVRVKYCIYRERGNIYIYIYICIHAVGACLSKGCTEETRDPTVWGGLGSRLSVGVVGLGVAMLAMSIAKPGC